MKYYNWTEKIDNESFLKFTHFLNENIADDITFYFETAGGGSVLTNALINLLNTRVSHVIVTNNVFSAGMNVLYGLKTKLSLCIGARGMVHYTILDEIIISVKDFKKPCYEDDKARIENGKLFKKRCEKLAKRILTKKEYKRFKRDKDVYLPFERMKEIFPNAEVI